MKFEISFGLVLAAEYSWAMALNAIAGQKKKGKIVTMDFVKHGAPTPAVGNTQSCSESLSLTGKQTRTCCYRAGFRN